MQFSMLFTILTLAIGMTNAQTCLSAPCANIETVGNPSEILATAGYEACCPGTVCKITGTGTAEFEEGWTYPITTGVQPFLQSQAVGLLTSGFQTCTAF